MQQFPILTLKHHPKDTYMPNMATVEQIQRKSHEDYTRLYFTSGQMEMVIETPEEIKKLMEAPSNIFIQDSSKKL